MDTQTSLQCDNVTIHDLKSYVLIYHDKITNKYVHTDAMVQKLGKYFDLVSYVCQYRSTDDKLYITIYPSREMSINTYHEKILIYCKLCGAMLRYVLNVDKTKSDEFLANWIAMNEYET